MMNNNITHFQVGDKVEAKYRGKSKRYYEGEIKAVHSNGEAFDIDYADGDKDRRLSGDFIRKLTDRSTKTGDSSLESAPHSVPKAIEIKPAKNLVETVNKNLEGSLSSNFTVGEIVEARYKGRGTKYYRGVIKAVRPDGTYDIDYDDGDRDRRLSGDFIRTMSTVVHSTESSSPTLTASHADKESLKAKSVSSSIVSIESHPVDSTSTDHSVRRKDNGFKPDDKVEALYQGRGSRWYKATVTSRLPNGSYNVRYEAGDTDLRLPPCAVRAIHRPGSGPRVDVIVNNSKTEAEEQIEANTMAATDEYGAENASNQVPPESKESDEQLELVSDIKKSISVEEPIKKELMSNDDVIAEVKEDSEICTEDANVSASQNKEESNEGPRRGRISKISIIHLYEITYPDGTKDINVPFEALQFGETIGGGINIGSFVDVRLPEASQN